MTVPCGRFLKSKRRGFAKSPEIESIYDSVRIVACMLERSRGALAVCRAMLGLVAGAPPTPFLTKILNDNIIWKYVL